jgi:hypothetical protein
MIHSNEPFSDQESKPCVIALHCSFGFGRHWTRLAEELGEAYQVIAPDLSGYGVNSVWPLSHDTGGRSHPVGQSDHAGDRTDPSRRPLLWRRYRLQDGHRQRIRKPRSQPDIDRAGPADAAARERPGQAAA